MDRGINFGFSLLGILIGWEVAARYARRSSQDLLAEANDLRRFLSFTLRVAAKAGIIELQLDEHKMPAGYRLADEFGGTAIWVTEDSHTIMTTRGQAYSAPPKWEQASLSTEA